MFLQNHSITKVPNFKFITEKNKNQQYKWVILVSVYHNEI